MNPKKYLLFGALLSIISFFCLASTNTFAKLLNDRIPVFQILFLQNMVGVIATVLISLCQRRPLSFYKSEHYGLLFSRSILGLGAFFFIFISVKYISVTNATLLLNTAPLFIPFMLFFFYAEKINHKLWAGIAPGFIGIALILNPSASIFQWHALLPVLSGLCMGALYVVLRQLHFYKESMLRVLLYLFLCSALITFPISTYTWQNPTSHEWLLLSLISLCSFLSQSLITFSLRYGSPAALAPLCYTSVIFSLGYDLFFWHNIPSWFSLLGIVLVIAGGITALCIEAKLKKS